MEGSAKVSVISHLSYKEPTGVYVSCSRAIFDKNVLSLVVKALAMGDEEEGDDIYFDASTSDELLSCELVAALVQQAYLAWTARAAADALTACQPVAVATNAPREKVEGDFLLKDWKVERYGKGRIRVTTPPLKDGVRENHMANRDSLDGDGFFMLANAMLGCAAPSDEPLINVLLADG